MKTLKDYGMIIERLWRLLKILKDLDSWINSQTNLRKTIGSVVDKLRAYSCVFPCVYSYTHAVFEIIWKSKCEAFTTGLENKLCTLVHRFLPNHTLSAEISLFLRLKISSLNDWYRQRVRWHARKTEGIPALTYETLKNTRIKL